MADAVQIEGGDGVVLPALWDRPHEATAALVLAHGAGAGMTHAFMEAAARGFADRQIGTLRFQFPFMAAGTRRTDSPTVAKAAVRAACEAARSLAPDLPLFAGGRSFGGRMTSQAQAEAALPDVRGLVFLGFPLHPAGKPGTDRAAHLASVGLPMLFMQGTRDALADAGLISGVVADLGARSTMHPLDAADHAFHVPKRSGRTDDEVLATMLDAASAWMRDVLAQA